MNVFIGIGSNLGDREYFINEAINYLRKNSQINIEKISSIIETDPCGGPPQGKFLNAVIKIKTFLKPEELLSVLQSIENRLGRKRLIRNGPRTIDLDILLYGDKIIDYPELKIPHPRMFEREFVMNLLFEIAPEIKKKLSSLNLKKGA